MTDRTRVWFKPVRLPDDPRPRFTPPSPGLPFGLEISPAPWVAYVPIIESGPEDLGNDMPLIVCTTCGRMVKWDRAPVCPQCGGQSYRDANAEEIQHFDSNVPNWRQSPSFTKEDTPDGPVKE